MGRTIKQSIKYYYYLVEKEKKNEKGNIEDFNIADWLIKVEKDTGCCKTIPLNGCDVRLEEVQSQKVNGDTYYFARMYKVRDINIPTKMSEGHAAEPIGLEEEEYIGEDVSLLYDYQLNVCMIQRNRMSIGERRLSEWVMKDYPEYDIAFRPIANICDIEKMKRQTIHAIDVTLSNIYELEDSTLRDIASGAERLGGINLKMSISVGRKKDQGLISDAAVKLINEIRTNRGNVSSAKVKVKEGNLPIETVDLIDDFLNDTGSSFS